MKHYNIKLDKESQKLLDEIVESTTPEMIKLMDKHWIDSVNSMSFYKRKDYYKRTHDKRINLKMDEYERIIYNNKDF